MEQPNKRQRLTEYQSIIDTIVDNEITNVDVLNSYNYLRFNNFLFYFFKCNMS